MNVSVYFLRVFKYLFKMVLLLSAVFILMYVTGTAEVSAGSLKEYLAALFLTTKGSILIVALIVVSLAYPKFGYAKRTVKLDFASKRDEVIAIMTKSGYSLYTEERGVLAFRTKNPFIRISLLGDKPKLWEDKLIIEVDNNTIVINGLRKRVVMVEYRLQSLVDKD